MGVIALDSYVLILRGNDSISFVNGLSTNLVEGTCTTIFTTTAAKIIDVVDVIDKGDFVALVGHGPFKDSLLNHISPRVLGQDVSIGDASSGNRVFISTDKPQVPDSCTVVETFRGWLIVAPISVEIVETLSHEEYSEYRVQNMIPNQGHEITQNVHPLACGLGHLVHESKGCYIGQEILARMRSRGRQGKELLRIENPVDDATTTGVTHSLVIRRC